MNMIKTDDGDGPEAIPEEEVPGFEAVFTNFSFQKEKFIKENTVLLVKLFFLRKGLQSHTLCRGREGSKN